MAGDSNLLAISELLLFSYSLIGQGRSFRSDPHCVSAGERNGVEWVLADGLYRPGIGISRPIARALAAQVCSLCVGKSEPAHARVCRREGGWGRVVVCEVQ